MNILDYLDRESPEISRALSHGFRKGDTDAVGRALLEEIKARKELVRTLHLRLDQCEKEFPGIKKKFLELDSSLKGIDIPEQPQQQISEVSSARLNQMDERINIIATGLATIVNSLSS